MLQHRRNDTAMRVSAIAAIVLTALVAAPIASSALNTAPAPAAGATQPDDARAILKGMSNYMASQQNLSAEFDVGLGVTRTEGQKIEFAASGTTALSRPNKLHARRSGGYSDVEITFDGQTVTILDRAHNDYAQVRAAGSVDQLFDQLTLKYGLELPGADLLMSNSYDALMTDVIDAKHIGEGVVAGHECEHLAFRNRETDWQIWVRKGASQVPCKLIITNKRVRGMPEYSVTFREWKMDVPSDGIFAFSPPSGFQAVTPAQLKAISDLPAQAALKKEASK